MVLALLMMGAAVLAWQHRASLSQLVLVQQSLDQASAAAALGAAQWHARVMNAHAMLNRTEMAHQVAMAHLMTLAGAWEMRDRMAGKVAWRNPPPSLIGSFFGNKYATAYRSAAKGSDASAMKDLRKAFEKHDELLKSKLARARRNLHKKLAKRTESLVREILRRNLGSELWADPAIRVQVSNAAGLPAKARRVRSVDRWQAWTDAVIERHEYLDSRTNFTFAGSPFYPMCPWLKHVLVRRGETVIKADGNWTVEDTEAFHKVMPLPEYCYFREYPMGWADLTVKKTRNQKGMGGSRHDDEDDQSDRPVIEVPENFSKITFRQFVTSLGHGAWSLVYPFSNGMSRAQSFMDAIQWKRTAHPVPYELKFGENDAIVTVDVQLRTSTLRSRAWRVRLGQKGLLDAQRQGWPGHLRAAAAARIEYDRFDGKPQSAGERFSLLQPFWLARQIPLPVQKYGDVWSLN